MFIAPPPPPPLSYIPPITIWVHGTRPSAIFPFLASEQEQQKTIPSSPCTIKRFDTLKEGGKTKTVLQSLCNQAPELFTPEHLYVFKWSGDLTIHARRQAAAQLYSEIKKLRQELIERYSVAPPVIIITHSHGGNVVLHMKECADAEGHTFAIAKTVLLACPVQKETALNAQDSFFGTVYAIHSHADMAQVLEPQRLQPYKTAYMQFQEKKSFDLLKDAYLQSLEQPLFSDRHFPSAKNIIHGHVIWHATTPESHAIPTNKFELFVHAIASKFMPAQRGVLHTEFVTPAFMSHLPSIILKLDNHHDAHGMVADDIELLL